MSAVDELTGEQVEDEQDIGDVIEGDDGDLAGQPPAPIVEEPEERSETEAELEEKRRKLAASATTWRNRVSAVLGEEAQFLVPCELCEPDIPGFHFPAEVMQPANETHARLLEVLRSPEGPDYRDARDVRQCEFCSGWGKVKTGSRKAFNETVDCTACGGYGYVPPPSAGAAGVVVAHPAESGQVEEDHDVFTNPSTGRVSPRLLADGQPNPNYGRMPQYKDPAYP